MDDVFAPRPLPMEPFGDSLGVNTGTPETIVLEFEPEAAPHVRAREWHKSQMIEDRKDGGLVLTLQVCNDQPLLAWILGFGPAARVLSPCALAETIFDAADQTRRPYLRRRGRDRLPVIGRAEGRPQTAGMAFARSTPVSSPPSGGP